MGEILLIRPNHSPALAPLDLNLFNKMSLRFRSLGFADDLNCLINDNELDLDALYRIISDFGKLSNLKLNEKKTKLVSLGFDLSGRQDLSQSIKRLGYSTCENEIKILGHIICINEALSAKKNWSLVLMKSYAIINRLTALTLNTRSKLMIIKTFVLSQLCYTARCFKPSRETLSKIEDLIVNFINYGGDKFSRSNIFKPLNEQGLGIPILKDFCLSQLQKNGSRAIVSEQPWALLLRANFKFNLLDRTRVGKVGSAYLNEMAEAICDMSLQYYKQTNHEVLLFFTNYILESVDQSVFNGKPPKPTNAHMINYEHVSSIKLKDLFHNDGSVKSKLGIEELLGYSLSFNSYFNLRSTALQCPLHVISSVKLHKSFFYFIKSLKSLKDIRATLYTAQMSVSNTTIYYSNKLNLT